MIEYKVHVYDIMTVWFLNGKVHREGAPAIEYSSGAKEWYLNGHHHRVDGPAIESSDGSKWWYLNGELHREDGPAIEFSNGYREWYLNGSRLTQEEFNAKMKQVKELTVSEISKLLGYEVKIVKGGK